MHKKLPKPPEWQNHFEFFIAVNRNTTCYKSLPMFSFARVQALLWHRGVAYDLQHPSKFRFLTHRFPSEGCLLRSLACFNLVVCLLITEYLFLDTLWVTVPVLDEPFVNISPQRMACHFVFLFFFSSAEKYVIALMKPGGSIPFLDKCCSFKKKLSLNMF